MDTRKKYNKLLFTHSYFYRFDLKQWENKTPYPPLGTIWAASYLRENGYEVSLFDTNLKEGVSELDNILEKEGSEILVIYDDGFNYLTKMCLTNMREAAFEMIQKAKKKGLKVFVSSSDSTDHYEKYLEKGADAVFIGEAEDTLLDCLTYLNKGDSFHEIPSIAFNSEEGIKVNPKKMVIKDLDKIPLPAWDLINIEEYKRIWKTGKYPFTLNIATTRGCPFKCNWCAKPIYGNRYNTRSPEKVIEEIELLVNKFNTNKFWMCDDIFGLKPGWVKRFNELIQEKGLEINYKIQSRADLLLEENNIQDLADSGLYEVWIGAESGSQKILDAMDKGITVEQIKESTEKLQKLGVRVAYFLQFGYLEENTSDIQKTIEMVQDFKPDDIGVSVSYPLPGTKFYDKVKNELGDKQNWTDSDELAMMFKGTFNTSYYKTLQRRVHRMFRKQLALDYIKKGFKSNDPLAARNLMLLPYNLVQEKLLKAKMSKMDNR